jgi:zeaxanthin glucosyltransferase
MNPKQQEKKKVIFMMFPEQSAINATLTLAHRLQNIGYDVVYFVSPAFEEYVIKQEFACKVFDFHGETDFAENHEKFEALGSFKKIRLGWQLWSKVYRNNFSKLGKWLTANPPHLVLLDPLMWYYTSAFLELRIPVFNLTTTLATIRNSFVPPVFSAIVPKSRGQWLLRARIFLAWLKIDVSFYFRDLRSRLLRPTGVDKMESLYFNPKKAIEKFDVEVHRNEYGYRLTLPELVLSPREFDFPSAIQANSRCYVGACVAENRQDIEFPWQKINPHKTLIYCSLGTYCNRYQQAEKFYQVVIEAFMQRPNWQLILQVKDTKALESFQITHENIIIAPRVPQLQILQKAAIFLTHGGFSSVREAILFGVPMIVFPCWCDQLGNAARIQFHHLGLKGDIRKTNALQLFTMIDRLLADKSCKDAVMNMQCLFRQQVDCQSGVDFIQRFLRSNLQE